MELPQAALPAWRAYRAMELSKQQHFDYLQQLEDNYSRYGQPSPREEQHRSTLLAAHDRRVRNFRSELARLRVSDPAAFAALVQRLQGLSGH
ncbi:MAG: hypothetical protein R3202_07450 [Candidatus Competibacterales bacterium]|nr:hypothetical protein [Candidatus Competibacterales bacterium]